MRSFCFEIIYGILLIVQKGHSTPDGQRVALNVFGRFLREPSASVTCRCGGEVQLDNLTRYEFTCPCCDFEAHGRTNLEDPEITVPCKCGNPVTMKWDRNKRMYHE